MEAVVDAVVAVEEEEEAADKFSNLSQWIHSTAFHPCLFARLSEETTLLLTPTTSSTNVYRTFAWSLESWVQFWSPRHFPFFFPSYCTLAPSQAHTLVT